MSVLLFAFALTAEMEVMAVKPHDDGCHLCNVLSCVSRRKGGLEDFVTSQGAGLHSG